MVIKLYISGISGNKEVKKKQQRVQMILDSKQIDYEAIDITEPGKEKDKEFMQQNGKVRESLGKYPLPPQIFNDEDFCGDYEDFDLANEVDELEKFLHIETSAKDSENDSKQDEDSKSITGSENHPSVGSVYNPYEYHTFKIKFDGVNGLKEPIINADDLAGEKIEGEEVKKNEVNGEVAQKPSSESVTENVESSPEEVVALEKEEDSSTQESKANDGEDEKGNEETVEDKQEPEAVEGEEAEKGEEEKEEVENPKEETVENEETSPPSEDKEADDVKEEKEEEAESEKEEEKEVESEKEEEKESDEEKSQGD